MATKKTVKKNTFVPEIIVDLTNSKTPSDVYVAFAKAKCDKYLSTSEWDALSYSLGFTVYFCRCNEEYSKNDKKPNVFKRFWNKITRKK